jgi:hypothetical protein
MDMPLITDRLVIRNWSADDAETALAIHGSAEVGEQRNVAKRWRRSPSGANRTARRLRPRPFAWGSSDR